MSASVELIYNTLLRESDSAKSVGIAQDMVREHG
jgi:hypothetical protein